MKYSKIAIILMAMLALTACDKLPNLQSHRYQIVFNPNVRADTFMVDTEKGKVWQLTTFTDVGGKPTVWSPMEVIDGTGEIGESWKEFSESHQINKPASK